MTAETTKNLRIELVYAEPDRQELISLRVLPGITAEQALAQSGLQTLFPDIEFDQLTLGVWGRTVTRQHKMRDGDRLEVYRPLAMDPREARRLLASHGRAMGQKDIDAD